MNFLERAPPNQSALFWKVLLHTGINLAKSCRILASMIVNMIGSVLSNVTQKSNSDWPCSVSIGLIRRRSTKADKGKQKDGESHRREWESNLKDCDVDGVIFLARENPQSSLGSASIQTPLHRNLSLYSERHNAAPPLSPLSKLPFLDFIKRYAHCDILPPKGNVIIPGR